LTVAPAEHAPCSGTLRPVPTVAVKCANLFHDEVEGLESIVSTRRIVQDRAELERLLAKGVEVHARCYCGHVTPVTEQNAVLVETA
jgi:hypothetical protein